MIEGFDLTQYHAPIITSIIIAAAAFLAHLVIRHFILNAARSLGVSRHQLGAVSSLSKILVGLVATTVIIFQFSNMGGIIASTISLAAGTIMGFASINTIGNAIAGILLLLSKPFKIGDRIKIGDDENLVGDVSEISLLFTKIRTAKNEMLSIPNQILLQRHIINLSGLEFVAASVQVSMGYVEDRNKIESLLVEAAKSVEGIIDSPAPHVLLLRFDDFGTTYEVRAYTNRPNEYTVTQSSIRKSIYDTFQRNGLDLTTVRVVKTLG